jgi:hypothetical protein
MQLESVDLIRRKTGDWWQDERSRFCAYCGVPLLCDPQAVSGRRRTRDHVVPRCDGVDVTVPSCRSCSQAKGERSIAEFVTSEFFLKRRGKHPETEWSMRDLWLVMALASVTLAHRHSDEWLAEMLARSLEESRAAA